MSGRAAHEPKTSGQQASGQPATGQTASGQAAPNQAGAQGPNEPSGSLSSFEVPASLSRGDAVTTLARAVRSHYTGALAFEDGLGIRRVVFRDGDIVTAASGIEGESLVSYLIQRGDLNSETAAPLERKLPPFGRHAGAALIAHGHLQQDELWPVLRSHAEWLLTRIARIEQGGASLEVEVPGRLQAEPAVFGGAAGAEVLVDVVRRVVPAEEALVRLGGRNSVLEKGRSVELLAECALGPEESELVRDLDGVPIDRLLAGATSRDVVSVLYALTELGVLAARATNREGPAPQADYEPDDLDEEALRTRVAARMALVQEGDYFSLLGLARSATNYEVERAYTELRRQFDPDRLRSLATPELYDQLALIVEVLDEAYEILQDQKKRERYRRALDAAPRPP